MNSGVTVVLCIVGTLVLCEAVLPQALAALHRRRQGRARAATDGTDLAAPGRVARAEKERQIPSAGVGMRRSEAEGSPNEVSREAKSLERCDLRSDDAEAQRLWDEARTMTHNFIPDPETDGDYVVKIYAAARLGHLGAMVKLGEYAYRRGAIVEAFHWMILAELKGADGLDETLFEMRTRWLAERCPEEYENAYAEFTEEQGVFARAVLRLQCDVDPQYAWARLQELADAGNEAAQLFLRRELEETGNWVSRHRRRMREVRRSAR